MEGFLAGKQGTAKRMKQMMGRPCLRPGRGPRVGRLLLATRMPSPIVARLFFFINQLTFAFYCFYFYFSLKTYVIVIQCWDRRCFLLSLASHPLFCALCIFDSFFVTCTLDNFTITWPGACDGFALILRATIVQHLTNNYDIQDVTITRLI